MKESTGDAIMRILTWVAAASTAAILIIYGSGCATQGQDGATDEPFESSFPTIDRWWK